MNCFLKTKALPVKLSMYSGKSSDSDKTFEWYTFEHCEENKTRLVVGLDGVQATDLVELEEITDKYQASIVNNVSLGDINGDFYIGIEDIADIAEAFGEDPTRPRWNPDADLNGDNYIGIDDLVLVAQNFGKQY